MWFVGLLLGALVGGIASSDGSILVGALGGAIIAHLLRSGRSAPADRAATEALAARVDQLTGTVAELRARISNLEAGVPTPATTADTSPPPTTPAVVAQPAAPVDAPALVTIDTPASPVAPTPQAPAPVEAPEPDYVDAPPLSGTWGGAATRPEWLQKIIAWFTGGNTVVRVGVILLFFGVAFALQYAYEHSNVPPELRVGGAVFGGLVLLALGWRLRHSRAGFAMALQGGGVGILYLTIFAALRLYALLPPAMAFGLLVVMAACSIVLAVRQDSQALAILAASGGFLAPVLASTGGGSHVALFSYYLLLDAVILVIASRRAWRPLNLTGFVFTFVIGGLWGADHYRTELWPSTQPFLFGFFLIFLAIPALYAKRAEARSDRYLDGTLLFGLPVTAAGLQYALVRDFEYGMAISVLVMSACYVSAAWLVRRKHGATLPLLTASLASLAFVFATLAIPLALDPRWSSAAWALEGAAVIWIGLRQRRWLPRVAGYVLQIAAAALFLDDLDFQSSSAAVWPIVNRGALGFLFLAGAGMFSAWALRQHRDTLTAAERHAPVATLAVGLFWWVVGAIREIDLFVPDPHQGGTLPLFLAVSALALDRARTRLSWPELRIPAIGAIVVAFLALAVQLHDDAPPLAGIGAIGWPALFAAHGWVLWRTRDVEDAVARGGHVVALWLLTLVLGTHAHWLLGVLAGTSTAWPPAAAMATTALVIGAVLHASTRRPWPVARLRRTYLVHGCGPIGVALLAGTVIANFVFDGNPAPLPYVPVLNPLDLASIGALAVFARWGFVAQRDEGVLTSLEAPTWAGLAVIGVAAFLVANAILLRALHHLAGTPLEPDRVLDSTLAQAALSLFWTAIALGLMLSAHRWKKRAPWIVGAALLAVTVVKMMLFDLANLGTVERIASFLGVGTLMLVVGYFAPVPPKAGTQA